MNRLNPNLDKDAINQAANEIRKPIEVNVDLKSIPLELITVDGSENQSSLSLFGRLKKITLDFLYAIPEYLKKLINYVKSFFKSSTEEPHQPTHIRFGEARVREFDKNGAPAEVGEIRSTIFEKFS